MSIKALQSLLIGSVLIFSTTFTSAVTQADSSEPHAVVLVYHHVDSNTPKSTSVSPAVFEQHLDYLAEHDYQVSAIEQIVAALQAQTSMPERAVAISFDDAYKSIYTQAWPLLRARNMPFVIFVNSKYIDSGYGNYLTWQQLREMEQSGARIANHAAEHTHLLRRLPEEQQQQWRQRVRANIEQAQQRLRAELDAPLDYFAYPYGEFDSELENLLKDMGMVAFGQQSGPIGLYTGLQQLPRFPMAASYANMSSFAEKLRTRPLPVLQVLTPESRVLAAKAPAPTLQLLLKPSSYNREQLRCYVAGQQPAQLNWDGDTLSIQAHQPLGSGRSKYNCTAPSTEQSGVYYWYSHLWIQPNSDGSWYKE